MEPNENKELSKPKELLLTPKQKKFVTLYVRSGGRTAESYMTVYKTLNKSSAAASGRRMLLRADIREAITLEMLAMKSLEKIDKYYIVTKLKNLVEKSESSGDNKYLLASLDMLCKIAGFYNQTTGLINNSFTNEEAQVMFGTYSPDQISVIETTVSEHIEENPDEIYNNPDDDGQDD